MIMEEATVCLGFIPKFLCQLPFRTRLLSEHHNPAKFDLREVDTLRSRSVRITPGLFAEFSRRTTISPRTANGRRLRKTLWCPSYRTMFSYTFIAPPST